MKQGVIARIQNVSGCAAVSFCRRGGARLPCEWGRLVGVPSLDALEMPGEDFLKHSLCIRLDHVTVTGDHALDVPLVDALDGGVESGPVLAGGDVPQETPVPDRGSGGAHDGAEESVEDGSHGLSLWRHA